MSTKTKSAVKTVTTVLKRLCISSSQLVKLSRFMRTNRRKLKPVFANFLVTPKWA